jgi:hypothetical protein
VVLVEVVPVGSVVPGSGPVVVPGVGSTVMPVGAVEVGVVSVPLAVDESPQATVK